MNRLRTALYRHAVIFNRRSLFKKHCCVLVSGGVCNLINLKINKASTQARNMMQILFACYCDCVAIFLSLAFAMIQLTFRRNALIDWEPCHSPLQELCTAIIDWIFISYNVLNFVCSTEWPWEVHVNILTFHEFIKLQRHYSSLADNATSNRE